MQTPQGPAKCPEGVKNMNWLSKLEYKYGRKAPRRLMLVIAGGQIVAWLAMMLFYAPLPMHLVLDRWSLLHGQIWRLITFLFVPVSFTANPLFFALAVYLIYWIGSSLENAWGSFKFDVYVGLGVLGAWLACLLTGGSSAMALYYSLFFAFAYLFPDVQLMLFFIIPIKVKWLGAFAAALYLLNILFAGSLHASLAMIVGMLNFIVFFGKGTFTGIKREIEQRKRRREWQNQWRNQ